MFKFQRLPEKILLLYRDIRVERHLSISKPLRISDVYYLLSPINDLNLNFRTQIFFGTSVRKDDREFGCYTVDLVKFRSILTV